MIQGAKGQFSKLYYNMLQFCQNIPIVAWETLMKVLIKVLAKTIPKTSLWIFWNLIQNILIKKCLIVHRLLFEIHCKAIKLFIFHKIYDAQYIGYTIIWRFRIIGIHFSSYKPSVIQGLFSYQLFDSSISHKALLYVLISLWIFYFFWAQSW